jgi:hypothetical protein
MNTVRRPCGGGCFRGLFALRYRPEAPLVAPVAKLFADNRGQKKLGAGSITRPPVMQCRTVLFVRGVDRFFLRPVGKYCMEAMSFKQFVRMKECFASVGTGTCLRGS